MSSEDLPPHIPRSRACTPCYKRKKKCDGARPACDRCVRLHKASDCNYAPPSQYGRTWHLVEERLRRLEAWIPNTMHPRYSTPVQTPSKTAVGSPLRGNYADKVSPHPEPPWEVLAQLLDVFLPHAHNFGFFLNVQRFRTLALHRLPLGHPRRPSAALMWAVYLWGLNLSNNSEFVMDESAILSNAHGLASEFERFDDNTSFLHKLQAKVLLAYYFYAHGRDLEGNYYVSILLSDALSRGLHKIRSSRDDWTMMMPAPNDDIEEGERIHASWTVSMLIQVWSPGLDFATSLLDPAQHPCGQIDTPWPLDPEDYEKGILPHALRTDRTILKYYYSLPTNDEATSIYSIQAKASFLWTKVRRLSNAWAHAIATSGDTSSLQSHLLIVGNLSDRLLDHISLFTAQVPSNSSEEERRRICIRVVAHSMVYVTSLHFNSTFGQEHNFVSKHKRYTAAHSIWSIARTAPLDTLKHLNPIIGTIWIDAARVLSEELAMHRTIRLDHNPGIITPQELALKAEIEDGMIAINKLRFSSSFLAFQINRIQSIFDTLNEENKS
ncbi:hypothetical protein AMATHDRAFT_69915 [Amanita thiersii Skay4041]|uniref:Zn(2)-C6 fungal-type domain-containing protein n=1 Tax=Amanita thiersii Skay4041 TaxID=703135 RepID=A0A2A9NDT9_9AGAR|nr:hypothetical protein AMATHDRAFT_69915 [Amanita thiersii Skay4041]